MKQQPPVAPAAPATPTDHAAPAPIDWPEFDGEPYDPAAAIPFDAVPRLRHRRRGWSEHRQRFFIFALSRCGCVTRAARAVGMTARTAYRLLDAPGADGFAAAWDQAIEQGIARVRADSLRRALGGDFVPVWRRGKLVRVEHRRCDRLAIALLSGREPPADRLVRSMVMRREHRQELFAHDSALAEKKRRAADQAAADRSAAALYQAQLEEHLAHCEALRRNRARPRIRSL